MQTPLVSIIIPTYNRAHLIGETLDSVLEQTYTNWECIVVDDGSTDETDKLLATYCANDNRFQYHHRPKNRPKGANACRNYGFELSKGEYVNWFDSDDLMLEDFLRIKVKAFTPKIDLIICTGYSVNENLKDKKVITLCEETNLYKDYILWKLNVLTPSIMFKKGFLKNKELYSTEIFRGEELEFFSRLFFNLNLNAYKMLNTPLYYYRQHLSSKNAKDKLYVKKFKYSLSYIYIENLKRSVLIGDSELIQFCYNKLIAYFFRGIENSHFKNANLILKNLSAILYKLNKRLCLELFIFGNLFLLIKKGSYRIEKRFRHYKVL